jgi:hypothetical protein
MSLNLAFSCKDWERIERDWSAWWAHDLDRPMVMVEGRQFPIQEYPPVYADQCAEEVISAYTPSIESLRLYGDAYPRCNLNFGPGIVAGFLGAQVRPTALTTWFEPSIALELRDIHLRFNPDNPWWQRVCAITSEAVKQWEGQVAVTTAGLGGNLDILASLRGTHQLLENLFDQPEEVDRLRAEITMLWLHYFQKIIRIILPACHGTTPWAPIWSKGPNYMLECDLSCMFSPRMFQRYVQPDLAACCDAIEFPFYHLDGPGAIVHLDALLDIPGLRGIQWVPTDRRPGADEWLPLLKRIIAGGKLCQIYVSPEEALNVVRNIGGRGFAFYVNQRMQPQEAEAFLAKMKTEDISLCHLAPTFS